MKLQAAKKGSSTILLALLVASILLLIPQPAYAYTKPSIPEFSVSYVDNSYTIPPTYGVDEFTGKTVIKKEGRHVDNQTLVFKIKNQPFTSYEDSNGNTVQLCYNLRFKGQYGTEWKYFPYLDNGEGSGRCSAGIFTLYIPILPASSGTYTTLGQGLSIFGENKPSFGDKVNFQVQALTGYVTNSMDGYYYFSGSASDWSSTQTITLSNNPSTTTVTPAPTQTPTVTPNEPPTTEPTYTDNSPQPDTQKDFTIRVDWQTIVIIALAGAVAILVGIVLVMQQASRTKKLEGS